MLLINFFTGDCPRQPGGEESLNRWVEGEVEEEFEVQEKRQVMQRRLKELAAKTAGDFPVQNLGHSKKGESARCGYLCL